MGDYIEREKIQKRLSRIVEVNNLRTDRAWFTPYGVNALIEEIPAADVRPVVKAHWYWDKDGMDWGIGAWRCSACKAMSPMWWNADRGSPMHKSGHYYCPNCGADMREES